MTTKQKSIRKTLSALVGAAALTIACAPAFANHIPATTFAFGTAFTINPGAIGLVGCGGGTCTANYIDFSYQAEVDQTRTGAASTSFAESGGGFFGTFRTTLGGAPVNQTGLGNTYQLYFVFDATGTTAPNGTVGVAGTMNTFNYQIYVDPGFNTTLTTATFGGANETITRAGILGDDILVLSGTLIPGEGGFHISTGLLGGDFDVVATATRTTNFFGGVAFTNNPAVIDINGVNTNIIGLNSLSDPFASATDIGIIGSGNVSFAAQVPEPASLSLLGLGFAGLAFVRRRKNASKSA